MAWYQEHDVSDPIEKPIADDDRIYADIGAPNYSRIPNSKQLRADAVLRQKTREHNELVTMLAGEAGQAVLMRLLAFCGIHRTTAVDLAAEGRRQVGLYLISAINDADPELYPLLLQQHLKRQRDLAASESAIAENHRRSAGIARRVISSARDIIRNSAQAIADRVW
jgi:hypothetical protein